MTSILPWLVGTKHFPESKNTSQNPKHFPESKNTSQNPKTLPRIHKHVPEEEAFWILERVFGFREVFCPWMPRTKVFTSVLRTKHSLNANSAKKKNRFVLFVVVENKWQYRGLVIHSGRTEYLNTLLNCLLLPENIQSQEPNCQYWRSLKKQWFIPFTLNTRVSPPLYF